jgi:hypothetical protein
MPQGKYGSLAEFRSDLILVVENCLTFNLDGSDFYQLAEELAVAYHGQSHRRLALFSFSLILHAVSICLTRSFTGLRF